MRYIDPYEFFALDITGPEDLTSAVLRRARQRKLSEFELSADGFLIWEGEALEKRSALDLAEALEDPKRRQFYWHIHQDNALTTFLKGDKVTPLKSVALKNILENPDFRDFCSPFVATSFDRILRPAMEKRDWKAACFLLEKSDLIRIDDMDRAYGAVIRFLERTKRDVEKICGSTNSAAEAKAVAFVMSEDFHPFVNALPDHFQERINGLCLKMCDLAEAFEKSADKKTKRLADLRVAWLIISAANKLNVDDTVREEIEILMSRIRLRHELARVAGKTRNSGQSAQVEKSGRNAVVAVLILIGIGLALVWVSKNEGKHNRSSSSYSYSEKSFDAQSFDALMEDIESRNDDNEEEDHVAKGAGALYEKIAKVYLSDKKIQKEPEREPLTGFSPYEWLVEKHEEAYRSGDNTIQFYNESERDVVVFIDHGDNLALQAGIYVRAKGMISNWRGSGSVYTVSVYAGEYWQDSIAEYKGRALPGFRIPHKFIGGKKKSIAFESPSNTLWLVGKEGEVQSLIYTENRFEVQKK